jgi:hypothetical protein
LAHRQRQRHQSRLKKWLRRFNGVASSYLKHCLGGFRALDLSRAPALTPPVMLALTVGV